MLVTIRFDTKPNGTYKLYLSLCMTFRGVYFFFVRVYICVEAILVMTQIELCYIEQKKKS
jgi:hypothetical protein